MRNSLYRFKNDDLNTVWTVCGTAEVATAIRGGQDHQRLPAAQTEQKWCIDDASLQGANNSNAESARDAQSFTSRRRRYGNRRSDARD